VVLAGVWPANMQMSIDLGRRAARRRTPKAWAAFAVSLARLPLQVTLIRRALRASADPRVGMNHCARHISTRRDHCGVTCVMSADRRPLGALARFNKLAVGVDYVRAAR
jgi:hypothetical protein